MTGADLIGGLGVGLCFSRYWPLGIVLMFFATMDCLSDKEYRQQLKKDIKKKLKR